MGKPYEQTHDPDGIPLKKRETGNDGEAVKGASPQSAREVGGENAFRQNTQPEKSSSSREYKWPSLNLPDSRTVREIKADADGLCENVRAGGR